MLLSMGNSLLHKGAHPTLVIKLFLIVRWGLPSCNPSPEAWPYPSGPLSSHVHTATLRIPGNGGMCPQEGCPQSPLLSLMHHDFQTITAQSAFISLPFHSQYMTPRGNTTPSKLALLGWAELSFRETAWCDFVVARKICLPLPQPWQSIFKDFFKLKYYVSRTPLLKIQIPLKG